MRKILLLVTVLLIGVLALPAFAQDAMQEAAGPTIAEVVAATASSDTPEFTTLLAAVQAADPQVLDALSNPDVKLTVFAPTDAAFAALKDAIGEDAFNAVLDDQYTVTSILLFHVLASEFSSDTLVSALEAGNGEAVVSTLNGQYLDLAMDDMGAITINGAPLNLDMVDIPASNGVIHVIDAVMLPETRTVAQIVSDSAAADTPEFTTLNAVVQSADPAVLETLNDPSAALTVFAPTDAAFAAAADALGEDTLNAIIADPAQLTSILLYHVVDGINRSGDLAAALQANDLTLTVPTLNGADLTFSVDGDGNVVINDTVMIVKRDVDAANGVIHVIDAVLLPPAAQ
jgi:transforming growth factor-beta-induced protein